MIKVISIMSIIFVLCFSISACANDDIDSKTRTGIYFLEIFDPIKWNMMLNEKIKTGSLEDLKTLKFIIADVTSRLDAISLMKYGKVFDANKDVKYVEDCIINLFDIDKENKKFYFIDKNGRRYDIQTDKNEFNQAYKIFHIIKYYKPDEKYLSQIPDKKLRQKIRSSLASTELFVASIGGEGSCSYNVKDWKNYNGDFLKNNVPEWKQYNFKIFDSEYINGHEILKIKSFIEKEDEKLKLQLQEDLVRNLLG